MVFLELQFSGSLVDLQHVFVYVMVGYPSASPTFRRPKSLRTVEQWAHRAAAHVFQPQSRLNDPPPRPSFAHRILFGPFGCGELWFPTAPVGAAAAAGWNVGFFYWDQFSDEAAQRVVVVARPFASSPWQGCNQQT